jgi:hypothetical protein
MIADRMALEADDLAWARPYADAARMPRAKQDYVPLENAVADLKAHLTSMNR